MKTKASILKDYIKHFVNSEPFASFVKTIVKTNKYSITLFLLSFLVLHIHPAYANVRTNRQSPAVLLENEIEDSSKPLLVPQKLMKWSNGPNRLPAGTELSVLAGKPEQPGPFTLQLKIPAGYKIPAHWQYSDEFITVLSGSLNIGIGDTLDLNKGKVLSAGSFARIPAKTSHYLWASEDTVLQIHGIGPWGFEYVNASDDPNPAEDPLNLPNTSNPTVTSTASDEANTSSNTVSGNKVRYLSRGKREASRREAREQHGSNSANTISNSADYKTFEEVKETDEGSEIALTPQTVEDNVLNLEEYKEQSKEKNKLKANSKQMVQVPEKKKIDQNQRLKETIHTTLEEEKASVKRK